MLEQDGTHGIQCILFVLELACEINASGNDVCQFRLFIAKYLLPSDGLVTGSSPVKNEHTEIVAQLWRCSEYRRVNVDRKWHT